MRSIALTVLLLAPSAIFAATKPDPADFTVTVHVISSESTYVSCDVPVTYYQVLDAVVDGQQLRMQSGTTLSYGVLALGDYKARKSPSVRSPKWATAADVFEAYDLLMPDGTARTYRVTRIGPAPTNP
jgi:hypothetical protein